MSFLSVLTEVDKIDRAYSYAFISSQNLNRINSEIQRLTSKSSDENAQQLKKLQDKKNELENDVAKNSQLAEELITNVASDINNRYGSDAQSYFHQIVHNIKVARMIVADPNLNTQDSQELPADLLREVPNASSHGFRLKTYKQILPSVKLAYLIEQNGIPQEHAYKLAILFDNPDPKQNEPLKNVYAYLKEFAKTNSANLDFLHDACLFNLPSGDGWTVEAWRAFVKADIDNFIKGDRGIAMAISEAQRIEARLLAQREPDARKAWTAKRQEFLRKQEAKQGVVQKKERANVDPEKLWQDEWKKMAVAVLSRVKINEINEIASGLSYARGAENPKAAALFRRYGKSEENFNKYLELVPKDSDEIPNVVISGESLSPELKGYYIKKMDPSDPLCALLGEKTGCCQSIGKAGETCAMHGITSEHAGFYVLCAGDAKNPKPTDDIRAQCWAWRSKSGALVFDSVEITKQIRESNVGSYRGEEFICLLYANLAMHLVDDPKYGISAVNVGVGGLGGTPDIFGIFNGNIEEPLDYQGYRDSVNQRMVCSKENMAEAKGFYDMLNNLILYAKKPDEATEHKLKESIENLSFESAIFVLSQLILFDKQKKYTNGLMVEKLLNMLKHKHAADNNEKSVKMIEMVRALSQSTSQGESAKVLLALYDLGLNINRVFSISEDSEAVSFIKGKLPVMEVLLKEKDWAGVNRLLDLGMDVSRGDVLLWALTDISLFPLEKKKIDTEQLNVIRRLIQAGANYNRETLWWNDIKISPIDVLIMTDNLELIDEFLALNPDRSLGEPIATAVGHGHLELMNKFIAAGFPTTKGDILCARLQMHNNVPLEEIDRILALGAKKETSIALNTVMWVTPECPADYALQLMDRGIGMSADSLNLNLRIMMYAKRYDVLAKAIELITDVDQNLDDSVPDSYDPVTHKSKQIPFTMLQRLIEDKQFELALKVIDKGASLEVKKVVPEEWNNFIEDETNFLLAACIKHNDVEADKLAVKLIAKGVPFAKVNLHEMHADQKVGERLFALAQQLDDKVAVSRLAKMGFAIKADKRESLIFGKAPAAQSSSEPQPIEPVPTPEDGKTPKR